jgi:beta-glucanase (GH16 family)
LRKQPLFNNENRAAMLALLLAGVLALPTLAAGAPPGKPGSAWRDDFSGTTLSKKFWVIASGQAPGYRAGIHLGAYDPSHVKLVADGTGSYLQLLLTQQIGTVDSNPTGTLSQGALIYTKSKYGYGTYEWRMRMSSTSATPNGSGDSVSGSVSAGFVYVNNSQTEIDFEFSALDPDTLYMVNWLNPNPLTDPTDADRTYDTLYSLTVSTEFHNYKFVWQPGQIDFYVDGVLRSTHTTNVPSAPAYFMINHWGTDSPYWGGAATTGTSRYFYVDWVQFTPLP